MAQSGVSLEGSKLASATIDAHLIEKKVVPGAVDCGAVVCAMCGVPRYSRVVVCPSLSSSSFVRRILSPSLSRRYVLGQYFAFWCICVINPAHGTAYRIQVQRSSRGGEDARVYPI